MGATNPPPSVLITDFSDAVADPANAGQFKFGGAGKILGGTAEFADATETKPTLAITNTALSVTATSKGSYTGVEIYIGGPACIDGSAYTGVQFDLTGSLGTCNLTFGFRFADDQTPSSDPNRGLCSAASCYGPSAPVTATGTGINVAFASVAGGSPDMIVDKAKLTGVQWQIQSPTATATCNATFSIDNVTFY